MVSFYDKSLVLSGIRPRGFFTVGEGIRSLFTSSEGWLSERVSERTIEFNNPSSQLSKSCTRQPAVK